MLRVLTLCSLYPNVTQPNLGSFVARQTERLGARPDVECTVIAPVARLPVGVDLPGAPYRQNGAIPSKEERGGLAVHYPRYSTVPIIGWRTSGTAMSDAVLDVAQVLHAANPFDVIDCQYFFPDSIAAHHIS
ncbi:MAG: glycosyltransferase family 4 protein, partial [Pacificimonas sp.]